MANPKLHAVPLYRKDADSGMALTPKDSGAKSVTYERNVRQMVEETVDTDGVLNKWVHGRIGLSHSNPIVF